MKTGKRTFVPLIRLVIILTFILILSLILLKGHADADTRTLTVTLDSNGGIFPYEWPYEESTTRSVEFTIDDNNQVSFINTNITPEWEGQQFLGWSADKNAEFEDWGDKTFKSTKDYTTYMPMDGSITTLYAVWTKLYAIELDANGGNYGTTIDRYGKETPLETYTLQIWLTRDGRGYFSVPGAMKEGLVHKGYSTDPNAVKPDYGTGFEGLELNDATPLKLYAIYGDENDRDSDYIAPIPEEDKIDLNDPKINISLEYTSKKWTGKALTPKVSVIFNGYYLEEGSEYEVTYSDNIKAGKATVTITGVDWYKGTVKKTFTINKAKNTLKVKPLTATVRYSKLKKANQTLKVKKVLSVTKPNGPVTYTISKGNKKITINKKTGKVTVKKGLKKYTYKVTVKVKAAGDTNHKAMTKTVTFKIKVN